MGLRETLTQKAKDLLPVRTKRGLIMARLSVRSLLSSRRGLPGFMIIGSGRSGTSSMFKYLSGHPDLTASLRKETEYFNRYYDRGLNWYRAHYPIESSSNGGRRTLAFEATPSYLQDPRTAPRLAALIPDIKLIALLRDPVARALSCWRHMRRLGFEDLSFPDAIDAEPERIEGEYERMLADEHYFSLPYHRFGYTHTGRYASQLEQWFDHFPRERFLIIQSEDFYRDPAQAYGEVIEFLGVRAWRPEEFKVFSSATSTDPINAGNDIPDDLRARLAREFAPHNDSLEQLLGRELTWARS